MYNSICVLGATATGKTSLATELAYNYDAEIISADSRQIYRGMDLGTGKDLGEYTLHNKDIPFHLIDIADAGYRYNLYEYQQDFIKAWDEISSRGKLPLICGGTGLYIEAVLKGYKLIAVPTNEEIRATLEGKSLEELSFILKTYKDLHNTTEVDTSKRAVRAIEIEDYYKTNPEIDTYYPDINPLIVGIKFDREERRERITQRLHARFEEGMLNEVKSLLDSGIPAEDLIYYGLEYKYMTQHLTGEISYDYMVEKLNISIHQFAKRQMTWFRKMEKDGFNIHWLDGHMSTEEKLEEVKKLYTAK
jgi:tRNA dimethylallyltransferase